MEPPRVTVAASMLAALICLSACAASPGSPGLYPICYVNAFQTQPGEQDAWPSDRLLRDDDGEPLVDAGWPDELILDTSTAAA